MNYLTFKDISVSDLLTAMTSVNLETFKVKTDDFNKIAKTLCVYDLRSANDTIFKESDNQSEVYQTVAYTILNQYFKYLNLLKTYDYDTKVDTLLDNIVDIKSELMSKQYGTNYKNNNQKVKEGNQDNWTSPKYADTSQDGNTNAESKLTKTNKNALIQFEKELERLNTIAGNAFSDMISNIYQVLTVPISTEGKLGTGLPWPFTYD